MIFRKENGIKHSASKYSVCSQSTRNQPVSSWEHCSMAPVVYHSLLFNSLDIFPGLIIVLRQMKLLVWWTSFAIYENNNNQKKLKNEKQFILFTFIKFAFVFSFIKQSLDPVCIDFCHFRNKLFVFRLIVFV